MLICNSQVVDHMASRVVSTKLTEEEYGKLVGLCSASGFTVSKLLKRAILERMGSEPAKIERRAEDVKPKDVPRKTTNRSQKTTTDDQRFLYY